MPPKFQYLQKLAAEYGVDEVQVLNTGNDFVERLSVSQIAELSAGYNEISRRGDGPAISYWLDEQDHRDPERRRLWLLLVLFNQLRERGREPFVSGDVRLLPKVHPRSNWSKLPIELRYLAGPADRFGVIQFEENVDRFVQNATSSQLQELRPTAVRALRDIRRIDKWLDEFNMTEHREAALVYFLLQLLNKLNLMG